MQLRPRQAIAALLIAGAAGAFLLLPALYTFGLLFAPPRPQAESRTPPTLMAEAIWARAEGGRATRLRPIEPVALAQMAACVLTAEGTNDNERIAQCHHVMPAMRGLEYLSATHLKDHGINRNSFRGGHAALATTIWMTRSWTREQFVNTLAARGDFGFGWRGIEAAARGFFAADAGSLTAPGAAMLASRLGDARIDPWCEPEVAALMRNRVLAAMRGNGAISESAFQQASIAPLGLAAPPEGRPGCRD